MIVWSFNFEALAYWGFSMDNVNFCCYVSDLISIV